MALNNADNAIIQGIYDIGNIQDRLKVYSRNKEVFKFWVLRQVTTLSLLKIISEKFGVVPSGELGDWKFKYHEMDEIQYTFYLQEASNVTDASNTKLAFTNDDGAVLTPSTRLFLEDSYCKETVTDASTDMASTRDVAAGIVLGETMRVVSVGEEDSAGAGNRLVTVKRAHPADSYANTAPAIAVTQRIVVSNIVVPANSKYQPITNKNSKPLENLIQITRKSYGVGEHMTEGGGIETYLAKGQEFLNNSYVQAETYVTKTMERAVLTGRNSEKSINGNLEFETGGVLEFVPKDSDHYIDMGLKRPSIRLMNETIRRIADIAGVNEMWMFTGTHLSQQIADCYEDGRNIYTTDYSLSVKYQVRVHTIESTGRAMIMHHVTAPVLNEVGMANEALVLNLTEYNWNEKSKFGCFQIAEKTGGGFKDLPEGGQKSYEENSGYKGIIRELYSAWGLVRRLPETHFILYNWQPVA